MEVVLKNRPPYKCLNRTILSFFFIGTDTDSNLFLAHDAYTSPSPEEQIIQQRSRTKFIQSLHCHFDNQESENFFHDFHAVCFFSPK